MSIYLAIANDINTSKVCSAFIDTKDAGNVQVAPAVDYETNNSYSTLSRAMAELDELEGDIAALSEDNGYAGKVWITCMFGLAVKINRAAKGDEIYQSFMDTAEGPWSSYCQRITALVNTARKAGIILQAVPTQQLTRSELSFDLNKTKVVDDNTVEIDGVQYTNGQAVTFEAVKGSTFQHIAGKLVADDAFVHGERELRIRMPRTERDHVHITVERFNEDTEDKLPNTAYGDAISWLRYTVQPAMKNLRDGRAPRAKAVA